MALVRFRPFSKGLDPSRDLTDIQTQMNHLFDNFLGQPTAPGLMEHVCAPAVDMYPTKNGVVISAELPGIDVA
jgi:HSP20 family molecular chaperone IbpA